MSASSADAVRAALHRVSPLRATSSGWTLPGRCGRLAAVGFAIWVCADNASAAALGGAGTSVVGLFAAIATWLLVKGWQSHLEFGAVPTLVGLLALAAGTAFLWRSASPSARRSVWQRFGVANPTASKVAPAPAPVCLPTNIDRAHLVADLRRHFVDLQAAWDLGSREAMSRLTTPDMLEELWAASAAGISAPNRTEVLSLEAHLLLFEERDAAQVVCVEFSGMVREAVAAAPAPFREFWMLTRSGGAAAGWRLARHQALL